MWIDFRLIATNIAISKDLWCRYVCPEKPSCGTIPPGLRKKEGRFTHSWQPAGLIGRKSVWTSGGGTVSAAYSALCQTISDFHTTLADLSKACQRWHRAG